MRLCDFTARGQLCEIAPAHNIRSHDINIKKKIIKNVVVAKSGQRLPVSLPWTVSAIKLNLLKLSVSKIFVGCVHTDKGLVMENSSKKTR